MFFFSPLLNQQSKNWDWQTIQNREVSTKCQINSMLILKNDVHVVPHWNQTPSHAASSAQLPQNTHNSAFIGICHTLIQSLVESFPLWWGGCSQGMFEHCRWALERTSRACVCLSSFVPRRLCHVLFLIPPLWIKHQMAHFLCFYPHPWQCCGASHYLYHRLRVSCNRC